MTDALWYIDRNHDILAKRACPVPAPLEHFKSYYCSEKRKRKKVDCSVLNIDTVRNHSTTIRTLCDHYFSTENSGQLLNRFVTQFHSLFNFWSCKLTVLCYLYIFKWLKTFHILKYVQVYLIHWLYLFNDIKTFTNLKPFLGYL